MAKKAKKASKARVKRTVRRARPKQAAASPIEAVAKKIVRATKQPDFPFTTIYTADCSSEESTGAAVRGHAGLEEKLKGWDQMQMGTKWKERNVWTGKNTVCIEWEADVQLRDGRLVKLREVAVHHIKDGKIQAERFYYNPAAFAPPAQAAVAKPEITPI